ncbi:hypothetical protein ACH9EU_06300 [Kocuria sp. M1R5S2]|uniref:hypothetical protein n=1 Tax=Kocuria rhizosphaerae TaxID=3376285 RepID=UPI003787A9E7
MCAGCPGGRAVSAATAHLNAHGLKPAVRKELQRRAGHRATVTVFGDQWVLRSRTGAQQVLPDLEHLLAAMVERGLLDRGSVPEDASGAHLVDSLLR